VFGAFFVFAFVTMTSLIDLRRHERRH
jgi:hypothetical protein